MLTKTQKRICRFLAILFGIVLTVVMVLTTSLAVSWFHVELALNHVLIVVIVASLIGTFLTAMIMETLE